MTITISNPLRKPKEWVAPAFPQPVQIDESELSPLGSDHAGRAWMTHRDARYGELREQKSMVHESHALPNALVVQVRDTAGERWYRVFETFPPGSFERALEPVTSVRAKRPARVVDALDIVANLSRTQRTGGSATHRGVRGAEDILRFLRARGTEVRLNASRDGLVVLASAGRATPGTDQVVAIAAPLLLGHLRGEPLLCTVSAHATRTPAVTMAMGTATGWCGVCQ